MRFNAKQENINANRSENPSDAQEFLGDRPRAVRRRDGDQNDALATVDGIAITIPLGVAIKSGRFMRT